MDEIPGTGHPNGNQYTAGSPCRHPAKSIFNRNILRANEIRQSWIIIHMINKREESFYMGKQFNFIIDKETEYLFFQFIKENGEALFEGSNKQINTYAYPLWEKYSSIQDIIEGYKKQDKELTIRGNRYIWRLSAAYCLAGETDNAIMVLDLC